MGTNLVAEYDLSDHLVVYGEGYISIYKREASARPARKRIILDEQTPLQKRAAELRAKRDAKWQAEWEARKAREAAFAEQRRKYGEDDARRGREARLAAIRRL